MILDYDDLPLDPSFSAQNQVSTHEVQTQNSSISSAIITYPSIPAQKLHNSEYSSLYDSIHAPKNKRSNSSDNTSSTASSTVYETITYSAISTQKVVSSSLDDSIHSPKNKKKMVGNIISTVSNNDNLV